MDDVVSKWGYCPGIYRRDEINYRNKEILIMCVSHTFMTFFT
jgi:hypothetical protein